MNKNELIDLVMSECPDMLSHEGFMTTLESLYCKDASKLSDYIKEIRAFSDDEYKAYIDLKDIIDSATVQDFINYLESNFKLDDKLCYMDCVEGYKNDCTYITKDQLGERFFYYVKDLKERTMKRCNSTKKRKDSMFPYVKDCDVVVI